MRASGSVLLGRPEQCREIRGPQQLLRLPLALQEISPARENHLSQVPRGTSLVWLLHRCVSEASPVVDQDLARLVSGLELC